MSSEDTIKILQNQIKLYQQMLETLPFPPSSPPLTSVSSPSSTTVSTSVSSPTSTSVSTPISAPIFSPSSTSLSSSPSLLSSASLSSSTPSILSTLIIRPNKPYITVKETLALMNIKKNEYNNLLVRKKINTK